MFPLFIFLLFHFDYYRGADKCYNRTLCEEHLNILLPAKPPFHPRQFQTCAVVGNSGDLLKTEFGKEIDSHDAVIRDNEAPVNEVHYFYAGFSVIDDSCPLSLYLSPCVCLSVCRKYLSVCMHVRLHTARAL